MSYPIRISQCRCFVGKAKPPICFLTKKWKVLIFIEMFLIFMGASLAASWFSTTIERFGLFTTHELSSLAWVGKTFFKSAKEVLFRARSFLCAWESFLVQRHSSFSWICTSTRVVVSVCFLRSLMANLRVIVISEEQHWQLVDQGLTSGMQSSTGTPRFISSEGSFGGIRPPSGCLFKTNRLVGNN